MSPGFEKMGVEEDTEPAIPPRILDGTKTSPKTFSLSQTIPPTMSWEETSLGGQTFLGPSTISHDNPNFALCKHFVRNR